METLPKFEFQRARDFGQTLGDSFDFIIKNFKTLGKTILYLGGPVVLFWAIVNGIVDGLSPFGMQQQLHPEYFLLYGLFIMFFLLLMTTLLILIPYEYIVLSLERKENSVDVADVWRAVRKDFWMILATLLGVGFLVMLSAIAFVIPAIYFGVVFSLVPIIRIRERIGFGESLSRSMFLIKKHWWFTLGLIIIGGLITYALGFLLQIPHYIAIFTTSLHAVHSGSMPETSYVLMFTSTLANLGQIFYPISVIIITMHYFSLVEKKEAAGLFQKIKEVGNVDAAQNI
jgi:hypothetical protein